MALLGEEVCEPAVLPTDVERHFFSAYRPTPTSPGLPGCFVPPVVPEEVIRRIVNDYKIDPTKANETAKLNAELEARASYAATPTAWRPWTADLVCTPCHVFRSMPWSYHGVHARKASDSSFTLTCGMLRDAGVISDKAGCEAVDAELTQNHERFIFWAEIKAKRDAKKAQTMGYVMAGLAVVMSVAATAVGGPAGAALMAAFLSLQKTASAIANGEKITVESAVRQLGQIAVSLVPLVGPAVGNVVRGVYEAAKMAEQLHAYLEARKDAKDANDAKGAEVNALMADLASLMEQRASLEELTAAIKVVKSELDAELQKQRESAPSGLLVGGGIAAVGIAMLLVVAFVRGKR